MVRVRLLGDCEVSVGKRGNIQLRRREYALLALACTGRIRDLTRDAIAAMLWPKVPLPNALHSLRQALHRLARLIPGLTCHCRDGRSVVVGGSLSSDVEEFQAAVGARDWSRAARLYSGPFLGSFTLDEAPAFCHWADGLRRHLELQAGDAAKRVLEAAEDAGNWAAAEIAAGGLLALNPEDEQALGTFVMLAVR